MLGPPVYESSLTNVTTPSAAASTGVPTATMKSTAFFNLPMCAGDVVLSIFGDASIGIGNTYRLTAFTLYLALTG